MSHPFGILVDIWNGLNLAYSHRTHSSFSSQLPASNSLRYAYFQKKGKTKFLFTPLLQESVEYWGGGFKTKVW